MKITKHAKKRMRQRGFSTHDPIIIEQYGRYCPAPGRATKLFFGEKECQDIVSESKQRIQEHQYAISEEKHFIQRLDHLKGSTIIMDKKQDTAITLYK